MKSRQETFDRVAQALAAQGRQGRSKGSSCKYRGDDGTKCAAGHLIPDEDYHPKLEGGIVERSPLRELFDALGYEPIFVGRLQAAHDLAPADSSDPRVWRSSWVCRMFQIAKDCTLDTRALEAAVEAAGWFDKPARQVFLEERYRA